MINHIIIIYISHNCVIYNHLYIYVNTDTPYFIKVLIQTQTNSYSVILGHFNSPLSPIIRPFQQKLSRESSEIIHQKDLVKVYTVPLKHQATPMNYSKIHHIT